MARELYRIVRSEHPGWEDFRSLGDEGKVCVSGKRFRECAAGVSVFDDFEHTCELARSYRFRRGTYVARLVVPEDGSVEFAQTFREHHYTIYYGSPQSILDLVVGAAVRISGTPWE